MNKYKQKIIPETQSIWNELRGVNLRKAMIEYFKLIANKNKILINKHLNIPIHLSIATGGRKSAYGGAIYNKKAEVIKIIDQLIENAEYNNWGDRKITDKDYVIGYMNFKVKCKIDNILENVRISIQLRKDGKFYYNHEINIIK